MKGICVIVASVFVLGLLLVNGESHAVTISLNDSYKSTKPTPLWLPPHLIPSRCVHPNLIWLKDSGIPDQTTVTLTVTAIGDPYLGNFTAAVRPSPTESMIQEVLPPYIEYQTGWSPTSNNNATIAGFNFIQDSTSYLWKLCWDVPMMKINDVFEIQYDIKSNLVGWQSIEVTQANASTVYGGEWSWVKYQNFEYNITHAPMDIWKNDTNDVSILVQAPVPDFTLSILVFTVFVAVAVWRRLSQF